MRIKSLGVSTLALTLGLSMPVVASAQQLVTNGGFEAPVVTGGYSTVTAPAGFTGWNVTAGDVDLVSGAFNTGTGNRAFEGTQYLDMVGELNVPTTLSQTLSTIAGSVYRLSFAYSNNAFGGPNSRTGSFSAGSLSGVFTHNTATASNLNWTVFSGLFTATSTSTVLSFSEFDGSGNAGVLLDAVSVAAVPEPASWMMMIAGFGLIGGLARRRRPTVAFA